MKVSKLKELLSDYLDDSEVFAAVYLRQEADEHVENFHLNQPPLTDEEWKLVVDLMSVDDAIWREIYSSFEYYIEATINKRKDNANVSSE